MLWALTELAIVHAIAMTGAAQKMPLILLIVSLCLARVILAQYSGPTIGFSLSQIGGKELATKGQRLEGLNIARKCGPDCVVAKTPKSTPVGENFSIVWVALFAT